METIFLGIQAFAALFGFLIACITLKQTQKEQKAGLNRAKKQATLDAYNVLQNEVFDKINCISISEIYDIVEDPKSIEYKEVSGYLARIEHFCVGLENDIYDYKTFYALAHGYFDDEKGILMPRLLPILKRKLENSDVDYYANLHAVWKKMDELSGRGN